MVKFMSWLHDPQWVGSRASLNVLEKQKILSDARIQTADHVACTSGAILTTQRHRCTLEV